ncbi:MAG TPA: hypothetical protein VMA36_09525 [Candidatus Limnocylindria bacterium]|nr:hypothetical protein [Candidatus Limnocylindria bacterium]
MASLCCTASIAAAQDAPLRHVEYAVNGEFDGRPLHTRLVLDLVGTTADRGISLDLDEPGAAEPAHLDVDRYGAVHVVDGVTLTREEALLVYFFALGAQNLTGMDRGDAWSDTGETGVGAEHLTRFRVVRTPGEGRIEVAFTREIEDGYEHDGYRGRLLYDTHKVVPVAFDARGEIRETQDGSPRMHAVHLTVSLLQDSQP